MNARMFILSALIAGSFALGTQVMAGNPGGEEIPQENAIEQSDVQTPMTDQSFVAHATYASNAKIEASKLALRISENQKLQQFAELMIRDHQTANMELKQIAAKISIDAPATIDTAHQAVLEQMQAMEGIEFDEAYVKMMQQDHDATVELFEQAVADPELSNRLRIFATRTLPVLRLHQRHALSLGTLEISNALYF